MKKMKILFVGVAMAILASCGTTSTVPVTGRKHNLLVTDEQVLGLSAQEYSKYMQSAKLSTNATQTAMVKRVGQKLATAVEAYLTSIGMQQEIKNFAWEFNLVQDKAVNAFCLPGGKIVVYEGLLPVTQDEASLAIVLGHEIAHAVAKHSAEQLSKQMRQGYGMQIGSAVLGAIGVSNSTTELASMVAQSGLKLANLRYSRQNESEADHIGLIFAAMAGYNPQVAVSFWQRMAQANGGGSSFDFLSDHPSDAKRIQDIQKLMPEAMKYYNATTSKTVSTTKKRTTTKKRR